MVHARRCLVYWRRAAFSSGFFLLFPSGNYKSHMRTPIIFLSLMFIIAVADFAPFCGNDTIYRAGTGAFQFFAWD